MENHPQPNLPRKLSAVLVADVQGYSRLFGQDEDTTHRETTACLDLFRSKVADFGGRIVRAAGDSVLADMQSAIDAVRFAVEMQKKIAERNLNLPVERRVEFRIGINLGDIIVDQGEIYGDSVNIAARLESLAYPGGICISKAVHEQVQTKLAFGYEFMGAQDLKNIVQPVEVYRVRFGEQASITQPRYRTEEKLLELPDRPSVAVLPFQNLTQGEQEAYLSDGITDDLTITLSKFRELFVISRNSAFQYKLRNRSTQDIGRELGVRYLVEGSLLRLGNRLRVTTQLIEAATGHQLWGERFDHYLDEVFQVLDELAVSIAATLAHKIASEERRRALQAETDNLEAYGLVLRGQELLFHHEKGSNLMARRHYERAVEIDPGYARAHAAMSRTLNYAWRYSWEESGPRLLDRALDLAHKAVHLDEFDARGYAELGFVHLYKKAHDASIACYERGLNLNPNDADLMAELADAQAHCGRPEAAVELLEKAMRLNPYYPDWYSWNLGGAYHQMREYEKAIEMVKRMQNPAEGRRLLATCYAQLGRMDEARAEAAEVLRVHPEFSLAHWAEVQPDKNPEDLEHFIEGLRKAGLE